MSTPHSVLHTLCLLVAARAGSGTNITYNETRTDTTKVSVRQLQQQLVDALQPFTAALDAADRSLPPGGPWVSSLSNRTALAAVSRDFFTQLEQAPTCSTVFAAVTKETFTKMLSRKLYACHSNDCWGLRWSLRRYQDIYTMECTQKLDDFQHWDTQLRPDIFDHYDFQLGLFDPNYKIKSGSKDEREQIKVGYIHILKNAYITRYGDVVTDSVYIHTVQCRHFRNADPGDGVVRYGRVFSIAQYWGGTYYHFTNEDLPRLALALPYLWEHTDVKIHISRTNMAVIILLLQQLGITPDRIVAGNIQATTAYIPAGTVCGRAAIVPINILSIFLRAQLEQEHHRDVIVLIKRSSRRWFDHHDEILEMLGTAAQGLRLEVFGDEPPPSLHHTRALFNRAVLVVGPHGAGLSNLLFSQPGTCVVEGLCHELNLVYKHLSQALGHVYYGVPRRMCGDITAKDLAPHVHECLMWRMRGTGRTGSTSSNTDSPRRLKHKLEL